jgi:hypothetical protein
MILTIILDEYQTAVESQFLLPTKLLSWIASLKPSQAFKKGDFQDWEVPFHCPQVKMYQTRMAMIAAHVVPTSTHVIVVEF